MSEKFDEVLVLDAAAWPALLVDASATIQCANVAGQEFFGGKVEGKAPLANIWTNENGAEPAAFLGKVTTARSLTTPLKLRG